MKYRFRDILLYLLVAPLIGGMTAWGASQLVLSKNIEDETIQSFYAMLAEPGNPFELPTNIHAKIAEMTKDGFSAKDYYALDEAINIHCGGQPLSFLERELARTITGLTEIVTLEVISLNSIIANTGGVIILNQLDATLCKKPTQSEGM